MRRATIVVALAIACTATTTTRRIETPVPTTTPTPAATAMSVGMVEGHYNVRFGAIALALATQARIDLIGATEGALRRIEAILPGPTMDISIDIDPALVIPEVGVGGFTDPRTGAIRIALDSRPAMLLPAVRDWLPGSLAHEIHHSRRILAGPGYGRTLGEAIVTEGLAVAFEREAFPSAPISPWASAIDRAAQRRLWPIAMAAFDHADILEHQHWFFGSQVDVPRWTGYTLGAEVVIAYLRGHPGSVPSRLVTLSAREIVEASGYAP
jgi:predicted Zn-dependent protease DUF2268